jgi:hypothetical protein
LHFIPFSLFYSGEENLLRKITPASQEYIKEAFQAALKSVAVATGGGGSGNTTTPLAAEMDMALDAFASAARNMDHAVAEKDQLRQEIEILRDLALQGVGGAAGKVCMPFAYVSCCGYFCFHFLFRKTKKDSHITKHTARSISYCSCFIFRIYQWAC